MIDAVSGVAVRINNGDLVPGEVSVVVEQIDVSTWSATAPDMRWSHVDAAGHFHAYDEKGETPTLKIDDVHHLCDGDCPHWSESYWDEDEQLEFPVPAEECEGYSVSELRCELCHEAVRPERVNVDPHRSIPGRTKWTVTVDADVPSRDRVSVVVEAGDRTMFGFGQPSSYRKLASGERVRTDLVCWPFAVRGHKRVTV